MTPLIGVQVDTDLYLSLLEPQYAEAYYTLMERNRAHLQVWQPWAYEESSLEAIHAYMHHSLLRFARGQALNMGIWSQGVLVGTAGLHNIDAVDRLCELGYWIDADQQGRGLVTRACRALLPHAFTHYQLNKVEVLCAAGNTRSRAIPTRLGFTQEGIRRQAQMLKDEYLDMVIYGMLASEWQG